MRRNVLILLFFVYCSNFRFTGAIIPKVCLNNSTCLLGKFMLGYQTSLFEAFLGIPYAKPPLGDLRFSNPVEAELRNGTILTKIPKPNCIQKNYVQTAAPITGSEDCLYLNVYRPKNYTSKNLPVLFYIHGGGFFSGSASPFVEGPEYFMDTNEVILVVPAYRLGPFGFLSTNDEEMPGNFGLKDQNLALKWVNTHISAFGGNSSRVTIFGHSAGAASAHFHMVSPASKGLFQGAILISGDANAPYAKPVPDPKTQAIELAHFAGVKGAAGLNTTELVKALRKINKVTLLSAIDKLKISNSYPLVTFRPNTEDSNWPNAFLTEEAFATLSGDFNSITVPTIIGNVPAKGEGMVLALRLASNQQLRNKFNSNFKPLLSAILDIPEVEASDAVLEKLVSVYMQGTYYLNDYTLNGFLELLGDANFIYPAYRTIKSSFNSGNSCTDTATTESATATTDISTSQTSSATATTDISTSQTSSATATTDISTSQTSSATATTDISTSQTSSDAADICPVNAFYADAVIGPDELDSDISRESAVNLSSDNTQDSSSDATAECLSNVIGIIKFDYSGPYSFSKIYTGSYKNFSTAHGDDSLFLFRASQTFPSGYAKTSPEAALVKRYVDLYVEFAKTGKVTQFEEMDTCTKASLEDGQCQYLSIVKDVEPFRIDSAWNIDRLQMWDEIYN
ncbi:venom carboxylesterase-6-like [Rhagoletis pomonella]|uniref:venom carboxylesterase-6-like n=1 Tax=Rhagoletis pomonella TaxID=28610 RepID=UPI00177DA37C|nr:venom carboxylesterase-6-like [Rhagoletis pomonella]